MADSIEAALLDVSSSVTEESVNKASIQVVSGLCHPTCDLCTHFQGIFSSVEEKQKLCTSCPVGYSLEVVHASIAAGRCTKNSQQRFESIENYQGSSVIDYLKVFSSSDWYPSCWNELTTASAGAFVVDTDCNNSGTSLCDSSTDDTPSFQKYCSTYNASAAYSTASRCQSPAGDAIKCFKCEPHLAECRCGKWKARAGSVSPSIPLLSPHVFSNH